MKREITLYQFLTVTITLLTLIIGAWINFNIKVADINARVNQLERDQVSVKVDVKAKIDRSMYIEMTNRLYKRLDRIDDQQQQIYEILVDGND